MLPRRLFAGIALLFTCLAVIPAAASSAPPSDAQALPPVSACAGGAFSTEEDFMARDVKIFDGNPYISDGDMLSFDGQVCMRNQNLTAAWFAAAPGPDLGLDALDVLDVSNVERPLIAFSTEVDDVSGRFTSGDLLFTPGSVIPNIALVNPFGIGWDIGLDGVQFVGDITNIIKFVNGLPNHPRDEFVRNPGLLASLLKEFNIDIWFTVEGTAAIGTKSQVLDGDLLSAATGTIVVPQSGLLPAGVPAGLPDRGVDFGLDGVASQRDPKAALETLFFSTEILFDDAKASFTDGDVLRLGDGIERTNWDLIQPFHPLADFLGLDALSLGAAQPPKDPNIQKLCGDQRFVSEFDGGLVPINGIGTGLYHGTFTSDPRGQPCGLYVPVDGFVPPAAGVTRFRVAYRTAGVPAPAAVDDPATPGVRTRWRLAVPRPFWPFGCFIPAEGSVLEQLLETDSRGWMDAPTWFHAYDGTLTGCVNHNLRLAVWDTNNSQGFGWSPPDPNGHYVLWLEWQDGAGLAPRACRAQSAARQPVAGHCTLPEWPASLRQQPGQHPRHSGRCLRAGKERGEQVPDLGPVRRCVLLRVQVARGRRRAADRDRLLPDLAEPSTSGGTRRMASPGVKNTDQTGTTPNATTVHLRTIDMAAALGSAFTDCCYLLDLWVYDASIRHAFDRVVATDVSGDYYAYQPITFAAGP